MYIYIYIVYTVCTIYYNLSTFQNLILKQYDDWLLRRSYDRIFHVRGTTEDKA